MNSLTEDKINEALDRFLEPEEARDLFELITEDCYSVNDVKRNIDAYQKYYKEREIEMNTSIEDEDTGEIKELSKVINKTKEYNYKLNEVLVKIFYKNTIFQGASITFKNVPFTVKYFNDLKILYLILKQLFESDKLEQMMKENEKGE